MSETSMILLYVASCLVGGFLAGVIGAAAESKALTAFLAGVGYLVITAVYLSVR